MRRIFVIAASMLVILACIATTASAGEGLPGSPGGSPGVPEVPEVPGVPPGPGGTSGMAVQPSPRISIEPTRRTAGFGKCVEFTVRVKKADGADEAGADVDLIASGGGRIQFAQSDLPVQTSPIQAPEGFATGPIALCELGDRVKDGPMLQARDGPMSMHIEGVSAQNGTLVSAITVTFASPSDTSLAQTKLTVFVDENHNDVHDRTSEPFADAIFDWNLAKATALSVSPDQAKRPAGSIHTLTATLTDQNGDAMNGQTVRALISSGPNMQRSLAPCTTGSPALAGVRRPGACVLVSWSLTAGTDSINLWADANRDGVMSSVEPSDSALVTWEPTNLTVTPSTNQVRPGEPVTITGRLINGTGAALTGVNLDVMVTGGPHADDDLDGAASTPSGYVGECSTDQAGACSRSYTGLQDGTDTVTAFFDADDDDVLDAEEISRTTSVAWSGCPAGAATTLTASAVPNARNDYGRTVWGTVFTISGILSSGEAPLAGKAIQVERRLGGSGFAPLRSVTTSSDGRFSITDVPDRSAEYRASFPPEVCRYTASASTAHVDVSPGVILVVERSVEAANRQAQFYGQVLPAHPGTAVVLQTYSAGRWVTVASGRLDHRSKFHMRFRRKTAGWQIFRVMWPTQDSDHTWNGSRRVRVDWR